jgi:hypothetical protein
LSERNDLHLKNLKSVWFAECGQYKK